jgi:intracellular multiplication protein IcmT
MRLPPSDAHWRDSARTPKFFFFDAKAAFPLLLFFLHIQLWTFIVAIAAWLFFTYLNYYGFSIEVFLRWIRSFFAGKRKIATPWWMT